MALALQDDGELLDILGPRQAALNFEFHNIPNDLCDNIFANVTVNIEDCVYYDLSHQFAESSTKSALILMHINIQSIYKNFESLCEFLDSLTLTPHVICLSETRLKS